MIGTSWKVCTTAAETRSSSEQILIFYFAPGGRLGNQIFQLAFIMSVVREGERCILARMEGALRLFDHGLRVRHLPQGLMYRVFDRIIIPCIVRPLCWARVVSSFQERDGSLRHRKGLLPGVRVLQGYFQSESFIEAKVLARLCLLPAVQARGRDFLGALSAREGSRQFVFVHIRRTDYLQYTILGKKDPSLPFSYYTRTLQWFRENLDKPYFIFVGDDPDHLAKQFAWLDGKVVSRNDPTTDLAIMSQCTGGILSNSTLAWWGARLIERPLKVFGPRYWLGWKSSQWWPVGIQSGFAEYVDVE
jgi:Glycosyl transferase family 11